MIAVDTALKDLYKQHNIPKSLSINFPDLGLTITNSKILSETPELKEQICSSDDLVFGACEASQIKLTVADIAEDLKEKEFTITEALGGYAMPFGTFKVDSCELQGNRWFKDIIAYDRMKKIDTDVAAWYNGLFPLGTEVYTLATFRASFLAYVGLAEVARVLPNDSMTVAKTISPASLPGRTVIEAIEEINGAFGHINRSGNFEHIVLKPAYGDYPTNDYPTNDYPISESDTTYVQPDFIDETITSAMRRSIKFEEYTVKEIDKLIIRTDADDIGAIVGTGTNAYIIEGNFLVYGKTAAELQTIATNAFEHMAKRPYRPYESDSIGLPYLVPGDMLKFDQNDPVVGYMFQRTLKGIQALQDTFTASGSQERTQNTNKNTEIKILQGKVTKIKTDVDGVKVDVSDLASETASQFEQTAKSFVLKVNAAGKIVLVQLGADPTTGSLLDIQADNISLEGLVTANSNFKILLDGSIEAVKGKFSGAITGGSININNNFIVAGDGSLTATGVALSGSFASSGSYGAVTIDNGRVTASTIRATHVGDIGYPVDQIHANDLWLDGVQFDPKAITTLYPVGGGTSSPRNVSLNSSQNLVPSTTSYNFGLGESSLPWNSLHVKNIYHISGGVLGLYGATPTAKTSISTLSSSATLTDAINKINSMINNSHGMW